MTIYAGFGLASFLVPSFFTFLIIGFTVYQILVLLFMEALKSYDAKKSKCTRVYNQLSELKFVLTSKNYLAVKSSVLQCVVRTLYTLNIIIAFLKELVKYVSAIADG